MDSDDDFFLFSVSFSFRFFLFTIEEETNDLLLLSSFRHHCGIIHASNSDK